MVIFHSYVKLPEGIFWGCYHPKIFQAMLCRNLRAFACESGTELLPFFAGSSWIPLFHRIMSARRMACEWFHYSLKNLSHKIQVLQRVDAKRKGNVSMEYISGQAFFWVMGQPFLWRLKNAMKFGTSAVDLSTWRTGLKKLRVKQRQGLWSWDILRMCWWGIPSDTLEDLRGRAPCGQTLLSQPPVAQNMQEFELPNSPGQILSYLIPILVKGLWTLDLHLFRLS